MTTSEVYHAHHNEPPWSINLTNTSILFKISSRPFFWQQFRTLKSKFCRTFVDFFLRFNWSLFAFFHSTWRPSQLSDSCARSCTRSESQIQNFIRKSKEKLFLNRSQISMREREKSWNYLGMFFSVKQKASFWKRPNRNSSSNNNFSSLSIEKSILLHKK